ncbi:hypothetical protein FC40_GL000503 [Ligilactobacillus hayakitensis DSM 18933 = JCM 14209]|uniref:Uncharacterized protein n=1 Tax=Ligilactobacillus hayakitensis DSM 18933 = JCM 14209 TaxID=1423755 RepID=A0A0R1WW55_9LACO|nr:glycine reductase [Ligilactobacillus hayakitensis]KRM19203.1 hypothetical protein FC40_GL000503 [Ligilactobacillus hayakitensis DSM 18933 = JCM 14209]
MEERNKNKKYRINSVEYAGTITSGIIKGSYTFWEQASIKDFVGKWECFDFDKTDAYVYIDDIEKELVPPELTDSDRKRFLEYINKYIEKMN